MYGCITYEAEICPIKFNSSLWFEVRCGSDGAYSSTYHLGSPYSFGGYGTSHAVVSFMAEDRIIMGYILVLSSSNNGLRKERCEIALPSYYFGRRHEVNG